MWKISLIVLGILLGVSTAIKPLGTVAQLPESSPASKEPSEQNQSEVSPRRLSITLQVNSPQEVLVKEGDELAKGQVIASDAKGQERLITQKSQLQLAIAALSQPLPKPAPPPPPSYALEDAAIDSAKTNLQFLEAQQEPEFNFKDKDLIPIFEADILKEKQRMANQRMNGHFRLNEAIANRQEAESNYQRELYQHQLKLLEIDQENRQRSAETLSQQEKLAVIEKELDGLDFRSPYAGTVRKVKILGQNGRLLNVEILVINGDRS